MPLTRLTDEERREKLARKVEQHLDDKTPDPPEDSVVTEAKNTAHAEMLDAMDKACKQVEPLQEAADRCMDALSDLPSSLLRGEFTHENKEFGKTVASAGNDLSKLREACRTIMDFNPSGMRRRVRDARSMMPKAPKAEELPRLRRGARSSSRTGAPLPAPPPCWA